MCDREGRKTYPCIKCGECVESCPMGLNPSTLGMLAAKREYEAMGERYHLGDCFECGCCTYVCPSNIPLVQQFRVAKQVLRERAAAPAMRLPIEIRPAPARQGAAQRREDHAQRGLVAAAGLRLLRLPVRHLGAGVDASWSPAPAC